MSENIMAASKLNLLKVVKVISEDKFSFKHKFMKLGFFFSYFPKFR